MNTAFKITVLAVLFVTPGRCFALWVIAPVSKEGAKELGMEVRSTPSGPDQIRVELEFKTEGKLERFVPGGKFENWGGVELRVGEEKNPLVTVPLLEDRSKPGRVVVRLTADRAQLEKLKLRVFVAESDGGTIYVLAVKDFVELKKDR
jgi:hypothetical protein